MIESTYFILYVNNQKTSADFYRSVLGVEPRLDVPGMTEFAVGERTILGLMPESGIKKLLGSHLFPQVNSKIPRAEVYLLVQNPSAYLERALAAGAQLISELQQRNWGHFVAYCADPDGHIIAFAATEKTMLGIPEFN